MLTRMFPSKHGTDADDVWLDDGLSHGDTPELKCAVQTVRCQVKHVEKKIGAVTGQVTEEHAERMGRMSWRLYSLPSNRW